MKVLILSCSTGGGHNSCAKYILEEFKENNIEAVFKDFYDIVNVKVKKVTEKMYLSSLAGNGEVFKNVYKLGELYSKTKIKSPVYLFNKLYRHKLYSYIIENDFDVVITTHLFPALTLTAINKYIYPKRVKFITVATDYEPCPFLEESKSDYLVIQKGLEERFISKGIAKKSLLNTGIIVSSRFIREARNIRTELMIKENEQVILIMLGSMGFGRVDEILEELLKRNNLKIMVVCGTNQKLYSELERINNPRLLLFPFIYNMNELISTADVVLSKPGGLSSTEVASIGKPLLHVFPIPGIETYNTKFFEENKMSFSCSTKEEIVEKVNMLLDDVNLQEELVKNQRRMINQESANCLVEKTIELVNDK